MLIKKLDWILFFTILPLCFFGLMSMSSFISGDSYLIKQSIWILLSIIAYFILIKLDLDFLNNSKVILFIYLIINIILFLTLFLGSEIKGSQAWISFGNFSIQPADFAKLALILLLAKYFSKRHLEIRHIRHIIMSFFYTLLPVVLILMQPDFGSAMVLLGIWFFMILFSGLSKKHFFIMLSLSGIIFLFLWNFVFLDYQKDRLLNFLNPTRDIRGSGYNVFQSEIAIGSGGLFGKDVGYGTQSRLSFLPEHETDFIFAAFAEEWGFVGVILVLILYLTLLCRLLLLSYRVSDNFSALFIIGVFFMFFIHIVVNIGMNLGALPVTGIPLSFMSYGGTHLLNSFIAVAIVNNLSFVSYGLRRSEKNEFLGLG